MLYIYIAISNNAKCLDQTLFYICVVDFIYHILFFHFAIKLSLKLFFWRKIGDVLRLLCTVYMAVVVVKLSYFFYLVNDLQSTVSQLQPFEHMKERPCQRMCIRIYKCVPLCLFIRNKYTNVSFAFNI